MRVFEIGIWSTLAFLGALSLYVASQPAPEIDVALGLAAFWLLFALVWLGLLSFMLGRRDTKRFFARWVLPPIVAFVLFLVYVGQVPRHVRFWMSRSALNEAADAVVDGAPVSGRIGYFRVYSSRRIGRRVELTVSDAQFFTTGATLVRDVGRAGCIDLDQRWKLCLSEGD
jgi:hypothetical protein